MPEVLSPKQRRTQAARATFSEKFDSPEAKSAFYRDLGSRGNQGRITLSREEAEALRGAYGLLQRIAERGKLTPHLPVNSEEPAAA